MFNNSTTTENNNNNNNNGQLSRSQTFLLNNMMTMFQSNNNLISSLNNSSNTSNNYAWVISSLLITNSRITDTVVDSFSGRQEREREREIERNMFEPTTTTIPNPNHSPNLFYFTDMPHRENNIFNNNHNNHQETQDARFVRLFNSFLEPIEIHPTPAQIEDATRIIRFGDIINPLNDSCPISLNRFNENDFVSIIRHCNHIFNTSELNSWFLGSCKCPVCRYDIRTTTTTIIDVSNNVLRRNNTRSIDVSNNDVSRLNNSYLLSRLGLNSS
jgi:hypothetical protein